MSVKTFFNGLVKSFVNTATVVTAAGVAYFVVRDIMDRRSASA